MSDSDSQPSGGQQVETDLLDRALAADLTAIAKKATTGQPLTNREREMLQAERDRRRSSENAASSFTLEEGGGPNPLERMTREQLAVAWGVSLRTIKNWVSKGREANDPAPLTRPAEMAAWYERLHSPRKCPDDVRIAAQRLLQGIEDATPPPPPPPAAPARVEVPDEAKGLLAMLDRLRTAEAELYAKYMQAIEASNETRANFLLNEWSKMGEKLRAAEKAAPAALEAAGIYVRRDEVQRELAPLHSAIIKSFRQKLRRSRVKLLKAVDADEWNRFVDEEVDDVCRMLVETDFVEPLELSAA